MKATAGDRIVVKGHGAGEPERDGEVLEVRGDLGEPPYLVRWSGRNKPGWYIPGPDAFIEHLGNGHKAVPPEQQVGAAMTRHVITVWDGNVKFQLDDDQLELLRALVATAVSDLSPEIADTDNASYRRTLVERRNALHGLLDALSKPR